MLALNECRLKDTDNSSSKSESNNKLSIRPNEYIIQSNASIRARVASVALTWLASVGLAGTNKWQ